MFQMISCGTFSRAKAWNVDPRYVFGIKLVASGVAGVCANPDLGSTEKRAVV